jgi:hypothetical protein
MSPPVVIPFIPAIASDPHRQQQACDAACNTFGLVIFGIAVALLLYGFYIIWDYQRKP